MINVRRDGYLVKTARCLGAAWLGLLFAGVLAQGFASAGEATAAGVGLTPKQLRCEYLVNPPGIDEQHPRLSWVVESGERGQRQTAYQVVVASEDGLLGKDRGDLWDSGKVAPLILSDAGAANTCQRLLPPDTPAVAPLRTQLRALEPSTAHISLYVGLSQTDAALGLKGTNLWVFPSRSEETT